MPMPNTRWLLPAAAVTALFSVGSAMAQQPVRPLPKLGGCPLGYDSSGSYCVPGKSGNTQGTIEKLGNSCPMGWISSGRYCLQNR